MATQTQLDALESSYKGTGEFLVAAPEFQGLLLEIHGHGSRQLGTLVRPLDETREGFDVDQIARFHQSAMARYGGPGGPGLLLGDLFTVVSRYAKLHGAEGATASSVQTQAPKVLPRWPHGQGFIAAMSWKRAGNSACRAITAAWKRAARIRKDP